MKLFLLTFVFFSYQLLLAKEYTNLEEAIKYYEEVSGLPKNVVSYIANHPELSTSGPKSIFVLENAYYASRLGPFLGMSLNQTANIAKDGIKTYLAAHGYSSRTIQAIVAGMEEITRHKINKLPDSSPHKGYRERTNYKFSQLNPKEKGQVIDYFTKKAPEGFKGKSTGTHRDFLFIPEDIIDMSLDSKEANLVKKAIKLKYGMYELNDVNKITGLLNHADSSVQVEAMKLLKHTLLKFSQNSSKEYRGC